MAAAAAPGAPIGDDAEWVILYHGPVSFKGRAEFLRVMLEDAGAKYSNSAAGLYGPTGTMDAFRGTPENVATTDDGLFPLVFPPAIWHRPPGGEEVRINQVAACVVYLGEQLGYAPATAAERAQADAITQNALDYISSGRLSFHPVDATGSYSMQKEEGDKASAAWIADRGQKFLQHFEKVLKRRPDASDPVAGGPGVTYADFTLWRVLDATVSQFNNKKYGFAWDSADVPNCKAFYEAFGTRPKLAAYVASDRIPPYAGDSMM